MASRLGEVMFWLCVPLGALGLLGGLLSKRPQDAVGCLFGAGLIVIGSACLYVLSDITSWHYVQYVYAMLRYR